MSNINLKKLSSGKTSEFESFVKIYQEDVLQISMAVCQDYVIARKITILAFKNMYNDISEVISMSLPEWIYKKTYIFVKHYISEMHPLYSDQANEFVTNSELYDLGDKTYLIDVEKDIRMALTILHEEQRELVYLRDIFRFDYNQISAMTGIAEGIIKSRIDFGRTAIKNILVKKWNT